MDVITPQMIEMTTPRQFAAIKRRNKVRAFWQVVALPLLLLALTAGLCGAVVTIQGMRRENLAMQQPAMCDNDGKGNNVCADFRQRLAANGTTLPRARQ